MNTVATGPSVLENNKEKETKKLAKKILNLGCLKISSEEKHPHNLLIFVSNIKKTNPKALLTFRSCRAQGQEGKSIQYWKEVGRKMTHDSCY